MAKAFLQHKHDESPQQKTPFYSQLSRDWDCTECIFRLLCCTGASTLQDATIVVIHATNDCQVEASKLDPKLAVFSNARSYLQFSNTRSKQREAVTITNATQPFVALPLSQYIYIFYGIYKYINQPINRYARQIEGIRLEHSLVVCRWRPVLSVRSRSIWRTELLYEDAPILVFMHNIFP